MDKSLKKQPNLLKMVPCPPQEPGDEQKSHQGQKWNGDETKPIDIHLLTRNANPTSSNFGEKRNFLFEIMEKRNARPQYGKRQHIRNDAPVIPVGGNAEKDHQRIHQNPLHPTQRTGNKSQYFTEIEASQCRDE